MESKNLAVMFTDLKGFTEKTSSHSRKQINYLLDLQDGIVRPVLKSHKGKVIKTIGDAYMVTFESPTNAVLAGMRIQEGLAAHNATSPSIEHLEMRIAINSGEVNVKNDDVFGEPVNVAARIEAIAEPGEVYFTESVYLSMNKNEIPTADVGHRHLKGIPEEIKVYKVIREQSEVVKTKIHRAEKAKATGSLDKYQSNAAGESSSGAPKEKKKKKWPKILGVVLGIVLALLVIAILTDAGDERGFAMGQWALDINTALEEGDTEAVAILIDQAESLERDTLPAYINLLLSAGYYHNDAPGTALKYYITLTEQSALPADMKSGAAGLGRSLIDHATAAQMIKIREYIESFE